MLPAWSSMALFQNDLMVLRDRWVQYCIRLSAAPGVNSLVIVRRDDEVLCVGARGRAWRRSRGPGLSSLTRYHRQDRFLYHYKIALCSGAIFCREPGGKPGSGSV